MPTRDPDLGAALENALPSPVPPLGAKNRVRAALETERRAPRHRGTRPWLLGLVLAGMAACVAVYAIHRLDTPPAPRAESTITSLGFARVHLRPSTQIAVERDDDAGTTVRLVSGTALFHVQSTAGRTFQVVVGASRVEVVGTVFAVSFVPPSDVRVQVAEGVVQVSDQAGDHRVAAGGSLPPDSVLFDDPAELSALRTPVREIRHAPAVPAPTADAGSISRTSSLIDPRPADAGAAVAVAPERRSREERLNPYSLAKRLELSGDRDAALAAYAQLSQEQSPFAEDALFAVIRLHLEKGAPRAALAAAGDYRRRFAAGRYGRDVDVRALDAHLALGDTAAAHREADAFLRDHPDDPRAWRFHLARAALLSRAGNCQAALADLRHVPGGEAKERITKACTRR